MIGWTPPVGSFAAATSRPAPRAPKAPPPTDPAEQFDPGRARPELSGRQVAATVFGSRREDDRVAWRTETPGDDAGWPELTPQGHLVMSDGQGILRMEPDGTIAWRKPRDKWTHARPAPTPDGGAVWSPGSGGLVAYDAAGNEKWRWGEGKQMQTIQPAVGPDGTAYVCVKDQGYQLVAVGPDGQARWAKGLSMHASSPPLLHPDGKVSVRVDDYDDPRVATFGPDGTKLYEASVPGRVEGRLGLGPDGSVYVGNADGDLFRVTPDGKTHPFFHGVGQVRGAPRVEDDGRVLFATMSGMVHCVKPDGTEDWHLRVGGIVNSRIEKMPDGTLLVGNFDKKIHALTPQGRMKWEMPLDSGADDALAVAKDGSVYVAGRKQVLCLREGGIRADLVKEVPPEPAAGEITAQGDEWILVGDVKLPVQPRL